VIDAKGAWSHIKLNAPASSLQRGISDIVAIQEFCMHFHLSYFKGSGLTLAAPSSGVGEDR